MKELLKNYSFSFYDLLWPVLLAKAATSGFSAGIVACIFFLIAAPFAERLLESLTARRHLIEGKVKELEVKLTECQNRLASLSLATGLKRQQP